MKVVPQIVTFIVIMLVGWYAYEEHKPFRDLMDDIFEYAGISPMAEPVVSHGLVKHDAPQTAAQPQQSQATSEPATDVRDTAEVLSAGPSIKETQEAATSPVAATTDQSTAAGSMTDSQAPSDDSSSPQPVVQPPAAKTDASTVSGSVAGGTESSASAWQSVDQASSSNLGVSAIAKPVEEDQSSPVETASSDARAEAEQTEAEAVPATTETPTDKARQLPESVDDQLSSEGTSIGTSVPRQSKQSLTAQQDRQQMALRGLEAARAAWYNGEHDRAIRLYWQLLREFRNHPDFAGELGNIYYSKGQTEMAVNAYSEAFLRLLRNNDLERARHVLGVVYNIDEEQAALLREYLPR